MKETIDAKTTTIDNHISLLRDYQDSTDLTEIERLAIKHALQELIEACLDIANHIIATESLGNPATYGEYFTLLATHDILDDDLATRLSNMARLRNKLVHRYQDIDVPQLINIINEDLDDTNQFLSAVYRYIDE